MTEEDYNDHLNPGSLIGDSRYLLGRKISEDDAGQIWTADDQRLSQRVSLRIIPASIAGNFRRMEDIRREVARLCRLSHPGLVRVLDLFTSLDEPSFIVTETLPDERLIDRLKKQPNGSLDWDALEPLARSAAETLTYLHSEGVVHGQLSVENFRLPTDRKAKLTDLGVSMLIDRPVTESTADVHDLGRLMYRSLISAWPAYEPDDKGSEQLKPFSQHLWELGMEKEIPAEAEALIISMIGDEPDKHTLSAQRVVDWFSANDELNAAPPKKASAPPPSPTPAAAPPTPKPAEPPPTPEAQEQPEPEPVAEYVETTTANFEASPAEDPRAATSLAIAGLVCLTAAIAGFVLFRPAHTGGPIVVHPENDPDRLAFAPTPEPVEVKPVPIAIPEPAPPQRDIPLSEVLENIAALQVYHMPFVALENGDKDTDWKAIPPLLRREDVRISLPKHGWRGLAEGIAMSDGYALIACNFNVGGNSQGDWKTLAWTHEQFEENGWHTIPESALGGKLTRVKNNEDFVLLWKPVAAGENIRIRFGKYFPPLFVMIGNPQPKITMTDLRRQFREPNTRHWQYIRSKPAHVEVKDMVAIPLTPSTAKDGWVRIPLLLWRYNCQIMKPTRKLEVATGRIDYTVKNDGYALLACNFSYQGNSGGNWKPERWDKKDFEENGWRELDHEELGGRLVNGDQREQVVFWKKVRAGETGTIRCNKYEPPYFIILGPDGTQ